MNSHFHYHAQIIDTGHDDVLNEVTVQPTPSNVSRRPVRDRGGSVSRRRSADRRLGAAVAIAGVGIQTVTLTSAAAMASGRATASGSFFPVKWMARLGRPVAWLSQRVGRLPSVHEVLGLDVIFIARSRNEPEMRKALGPRARDTTLNRRVVLALGKRDLGG